MKIYLARNQVQAGPYTLDELNIMLASGEVLLDDLIWHTGMDQWQRLGDVTNNQYHYQPKTAQAWPSNPSSQQQEQVRGFGDNPDFQPTNQNPQARISVEELYGNKPAASQNSAQARQAKTFNTDKQAENQAVIYAGIGQRFLAVAVNFVLFILTLMPFMQALIGLNPDPNKLGAGDLSDRMTYAQMLADKMPPDVGLMTSLLLLAYVFIQVLLIVVRGQSFGKMVTGICVVDAKSHQKPKLLNRLVIRLVLLGLIYWFAFSVPLPINLGFLLLAINYWMASKNPIKQGWHDKLAGTTVVKISSVKKKD